MKRVCLFALGLCLGLSVLPADDAATVRVFPRPAAVTPSAASQGIVVTSVSVGLYDPALPCFMCVAGATQNNLGMSQPLAWVQHGTEVTFSVVADDLSYSGQCSFTYAVHQGSQLGKILLRGSAGIPGGCYPAGWVASFNVKVPDNPGFYTLEGVVDAGGTPSVLTVPLHIQ